MSISVATESEVALAARVGLGDDQARLEKVGGGIEWSYRVLMRCGHEVSRCVPVRLASV